MSSLLLANGVLFSAGEVLGGDAVGVRDGQIVAVGSRRDVREALRVVDAELDAGGGLIAPGFVDAHIHLGGGAVDSLRCDLAGAESLDEIDRRVRAFAAGTSSPWIVGAGGIPPSFRPVDRPRRTWTRWCPTGRPSSWMPTTTVPGRTPPP